MFVGRITGVDANLYESPSEEAKVIGILSNIRFLPLTIASVNGQEWFKIETDSGQVGYVHDWLVDISRQCTVKAQHVQVMTKKVGGVVLMDIPPGSTLRTWLPLELGGFSSSDPWVEVECEKGAGYIDGTRALTVPPLGIGYELTKGPKGHNPANSGPTVVGVIILIGIAALIIVSMTTRTGYEFWTLAIGALLGYGLLFRKRK